MRATASLPCSGRQACNAQWHVTEQQRDRTTSRLVSSEFTPVPTVVEEDTGCNCAASRQPPSATSRKSLSAGESATGIAEQRVIKGILNRGTWLKGSCDAIGDRASSEGCK